MEFALGAEMVVEHRWHDTGARGDVLHLRLGEAVFGEHFDGRVEDADPPLFAGIRVLAIPNTNSVSCRHITEPQFGWTECRP